MNLIKNLFAIALIAFAFAACNNTDKADADTSTDEGITEQVDANSPEGAVEEMNAELAKFEFICEHCQAGSHEAGMCPCGMEYTKNANFLSVEGHSHDGHGHSHDKEGDDGHNEQNHDGDGHDSDGDEKS